MNKKWFLLLASLMLSALMVAGCGANDDPSPPVDENQDQEQAPIEDDPLQDAENNRDDIGDNNTNENNNDNNIENDMEEPVDETEENMKSDEEMVEEHPEGHGNNGNDEKNTNPEKE
ncbi:hypothetical protein [Mesobacillus maritimus]|uniref:Uncharacterized protein n=1 Tax=Mesobacillus maritimus TaxID=1643336 RepID=A0ABS7K1W0_9BACI|nr:hypothetical protein [Mesobacillus maritimus]MBY0096150.1 hypothetical protein [Mesobacillus maritimus]